MSLDTRSVTLILVIINALTGGAILVGTRGYLREVRGPTTWGWASLVQALGWLIFGVLRGTMPEAASIIVGQLLIQYSLLLYLRALDEFFGRRFRSAWWYALLVAGGAGLVLTSVVAPSFANRQIVISASKAIMVFWGAQVVWRSTPSRASHSFTAGLFAAMGGMMVLRILTFVFWHQIANDQPLQDHWFSQVTYLSYFVSGVLLTVGFMLMVGERYLDGRKESEERFRHASLIDPLTQLPNRVMISEHIRDVAGRTERHPGDLYAVMFVDLDDFKGINDSLGHDAGDEVLVEAGRRLVSGTRPDDGVERGAMSMAGRFGGDEFVIVLDHLRKPADALSVAARMQAAMKRPFHLGDRAVAVGCSIGISIGQRGAQASSMDDLVRDADAAMYQAKAAGKGGCALFDESMRGQVSDR